MGLTASYDPGKVDVVLDGLIVQGFGTDDMVEIAPVGDQIWEEAIGVAGSITRSRNYESDHYVVTLTLKHGSPSIKILETLRQADKTGQIPQIPSAMAIYNRTEGGGFGAKNVWVRNEPTTTYSGDTPEYEYELLAAHAQIFRQTASTDEINAYLDKIGVPDASIKKYS